MEEKKGMILYYVQEEKKKIQKIGRASCRERV